jgi:hypothetical protein
MPNGWVRWWLHWLRFRFPPKERSFVFFALGIVDGFDLHFLFPIRFDGGRGVRHAGFHAISFSMGRGRERWTDAGRG